MAPKTTDRKIDTWEWHDLSIAPKKLEFEVRLERPVNIAEGSLRYYVKHDDPAIYVEAGDLGPLRDKIDAAVREFYAIVWEPVLVATVERSQPIHHHRPSFELIFEVTEYERGTLHGEPVYRKKRPIDAKAATHSSFEYAIKQGEMERTFRRFGSSPPLTVYVLADTPENRGLFARFDREADSMLRDITASLQRKAI